MLCKLALEFLTFFIVTAVYGDAGRISGLDQHEWPLENTFSEVTALYDHATVRKHITTYLL